MGHYLNVLVVVKENLNGEPAENQHQFFQVLTLTHAEAPLVMDRQLAPQEGDLIAVHATQDTEEMDARA